jgi:nucleoside-diphosphate-sugar epimerase
VAQAEDGSFIEVWGDGTAIRAYTYVDDLVDGIYMLMQSAMREPVTIGSSEFVTVDQLAATAIKISGKQLAVKHIDGPVGVQARILDKNRIKAMGWEANTTFEDGLTRTYAWIDQQVQEQNK